MINYLDADASSAPSTAPAQSSGSLAVVVTSCDKYSDLWQPLFKAFFAHWPDCPYPIYLIANFKQFPDHRVCTLLVGEDEDWSTTVEKAVQQLKHTHILFWMDDAFLSRRVNNDKVEQLFSHLRRVDGNYLRLRPEPRPDLYINDAIGIIPPGAFYRVSLPASIWKLSALHQVIQRGETAWEFEIKGSVRSGSLSGFYAARTASFGYIHGVERGTWIRSAALALERKGYTLDYSARRRMTFVEDLGARYRLSKTLILHIIPERWRGFIMALARSVRSLVHSKHAG
jgi:hypothetical protein